MLHFKVCKRSDSVLSLYPMMDFVFFSSFRSESHTSLTLIFHFSADLFQRIKKKKVQQTS